MLLTEAAYHVVMLAVDALAIVSFRREEGDADQAIVWVLVHTTAWLMLGALLGQALERDPLAMVRLWCWGLFVHQALVLLALAWMRREKVKVAGWLVGAVVVLELAAVDAFVIEPPAIRAVHHEVALEDAPMPLTVAVLADFHADRVGDHERRAIGLAMEAEPDVLIFAGDYVESPDEDAVLAELRRLLVELGPSAPLAVAAVRGHVDSAAWRGLFAGIARAQDDSWTEDVAPGVRLTALSLEDSRDPKLRAGSHEGLHIMVGHSPDFTRGAISADLVIAGHTHGGQLRVPGLGPFFTASRLPRRQADGFSWLRPGQALVVSRGIGLVRGVAPRFRFLCRPEVTIVHVVPAGS